MLYYGYAPGQIDLAIDCRLAIVLPTIVIIIKYIDVDLGMGLHV